MRRLRRGDRVPEDVRERAGLAGVKVLAHGQAQDGSWLLGTREHLVIVLAGGGVRHLPWGQVQEAEWDKDDQRLVISEVGRFGEVRPQHAFVLEDEGLLLQLVRERVQASVVLQRHVAVSGKRGVKVIGRRRPDGSVEWMVEYDIGIDPDAPEVVRRVDAALEQARRDGGE